ncbi:MAG: hypothetical protein Q9160_007170 [Pyrenula sp. 1 TL-2023]
MKHISSCLLFSIAIPFLPLTISRPQQPADLSPTRVDAVSPTTTQPSPSPSHSQNEWEKNGLVEWEKKKYFKEPGGDDILGHYDNRFYHGVVKDVERRDTLLHLIRAYLMTMREIGLDTWIAHGTLLGWWWNGRMLPWDWDVDVQVSYPTVRYMGDNLNMTKHKYTSPDGTVHREYLLDINPHSVEIDRGDGTNIIDARWIDTRNGLYVDITALSEKSPSSAPGVWSCKNDHKYKTKELYPMRETTYEGVPARIPYSYDSILTEEYTSQALVREEFQG